MNRLVRRPRAPRGLAAPQGCEADCGLSAAGAHVHPGATRGTTGCCRSSTVCDVWRVDGHEVQVGVPVSALVVSPCELMGAAPLMCRLVRSGGHENLAPRRHLEASQDLQSLRRVGVHSAADGAAGRHLHPPFQNELIELCTGMLLAAPREADRTKPTRALRSDVWLKLQYGRLGSHQTLRGRLRSPAERSCTLHLARM